MTIQYNPKLKELAKKLRKNSTRSEIILWNHLKRKQMMGCDFHRQKPIGDFIVDFYCSRLHVIIEIDGSSHDYKGQKDKLRAKYLTELGFTILRYSDKDVRGNLDNVLVSIQLWIKHHGS